MYNFIELNIKYILHFELILWILKLDGKKIVYIKVNVHLAMVLSESAS